MMRVKHLTIIIGYKISKLIYYEKFNSLTFELTMTSKVITSK